VDGSLEGLPCSQGLGGSMEGNGLGSSQKAPQFLGLSEQVIPTPESSFVLPGTPSPLHF
jgi:hypothetical protein